ncbi:hypothetical protein K6U21_17060, partial [Vibrio vulnificus]|uniref:hypothetical protein n=1 Tax=Vibrio vulnificus TaxID=672 RepID=UPI001EEA3C6D
FHARLTPWRARPHAGTPHNNQKIHSYQIPIGVVFCASAHLVLIFVHASKTTVERLVFFHDFFDGFMYY